MFNTGIHYSFIASIVAMLISLAIFIASKKGLPNPSKKEDIKSVNYTPEERAAMANEIKRRMYALLLFWV